ncbi:nuclear transport factor 2 family protein [Streptacidiphilus albus]|uniref:nuclear transport factor 2 family protein n=1 Tax=Streptacidiphilus albus TaxID=105425 RepID=UPI00068F36C7|nr:nuclear transport factor 2 family protein [Streptacidiphilus albus]
MSTHTRTPRETVELLIRITAEGDRSQLADLYAPDVVIDMPFTRPGFPGRTEGNDSMRTRMKAVSGLWSYESVDGVVIHETADPEVVIAEFRVHGRITAGGEQFTLTYIMVSRVVDGLIVSSSDYGNPLESEVLLAALPRPLDA